MGPKLNLAALLSTINLHPAGSDFNLTVVLKVVNFYVDSVTFGFFLT